MFEWGASVISNHVSMRQGLAVILQWKVGQTWRALICKSIITKWQVAAKSKALVRWRLWLKAKQANLLKVMTHHVTFVQLLHLKMKPLGRSQRIGGK